MCIMNTLVKAGKYWLNLVELPYSKLPKAAYKTLKVMDDRGVFTWVTEVRTILFILVLELYGSLALCLCVSACLSLPPPSLSPSLSLSPSPSLSLSLSLPHTDTDTRKINFLVSDVYIHACIISQCYYELIYYCFVLFIIID